VLETFWFTIIESHHRNVAFLKWYFLKLCGGNWNLKAYKGIFILQLFILFPGNNKHKYPIKNILKKMGFPQEIINLVLKAFDKPRVIHKLHNLHTSEKII